MNVIDVSVIMPCFNGEKYLLQAIESFIKNCSQNCELIIIDDGSTDNSPELISKCQLKYKDCSIVYYRIDNHGVSYARNYGLQKAVGKYILFLDCDDCFSDNFIHSLLLGVKENQADLSFCYWRSEEKNCTINKSFFVEKDAFAKMILYHKKRIHLCSMMYCNDIIKKYKISFRTDLKYGEDIDFIWKYMVHCSKFYFSANCFFFHRDNHDSVMHRFSYSKIDTIEMYRDNEKLIDLFYPIFLDTYKKYAVQRGVIAVQKELAINGEEQLFNSICMKYRELPFNSLLIHDGIMNRIASLIYIVSPKLFYNLLKGIRLR